MTDENQSVYLTSDSAKYTIEVDKVMIASFLQIRNADTRKLLVEVPIEVDFKKIPVALHTFVANTLLSMRRSLPVASHVCVPIEEYLKTR